MYRICFFSKISGMFSSFASQVDSRFKCIDQKFIDLEKPSSSQFPSSQGISAVSQDINQFPFSARTTSVVVLHCEHPFG